MMAGKSYGAFVKSIQAVEIALSSGNSSNTATITAVDPNNSFLTFAGSNTDQTTRSDAQNSRIELTNGTTVTASRVNTSGGNIVNATVVELMPGIIKNVYRGTVTINTSQLSGSANLAAAVDPAKSFCTYLGLQSSYTSENPEYTLNRVYINTSGFSQVVAARGATTSSSQQVVGYEVVEFN